MSTRIPADAFDRLILIVNDEAGKLKANPSDSNPLIIKIRERAMRDLSQYTGFADTEIDRGDLEKVIQDQIAIHFFKREVIVLQELKEQYEGARVQGTDLNEIKKELKAYIDGHEDKELLQGATAPIPLGSMDQILQILPQVSTLELPEESDADKQNEAMRTTASKAMQIASSAGAKTVSKGLKTFVQGTTSAPKVLANEKSEVDQIYQKHLSSLSQKLRTADEQTRLTKYLELRQKYTPEEIQTNQTGECKSFRDDYITNAVRFPVVRFLNQKAEVFKELEMGFDKLRSEVFLEVYSSIPKNASYKETNLYQDVLSGYFYTKSALVFQNWCDLAIQGRANLIPQSNEQSLLRQEFHQKLNSLLPSLAISGEVTSTVKTDETALHCYIQNRMAGRSPADSYETSKQYLGNISEKIRVRENNPDVALEAAYEAWVVDFLYDRYKAQSSPTPAAWAALGFSKTDQSHFERKCRDRKDEEIFTACFDTRVQGSFDANARLAQLKVVLKEKGIVETDLALQFFLNLAKDVPEGTLDSFARVVSGKAETNCAAFQAAFPKGLHQDKTRAKEHLEELFELGRQAKETALFNRYMDPKQRDAVVRELKAARDGTSQLENLEKRKTEEIAKQINIIRGYIPNYLTVEGRVHISKFPSSASAIKFTEQSVIQKLKEAKEFLDKCDRKDLCSYFQEHSGNAENLFVFYDFIARHEPTFQTPEDFYAANKTDPQVAEKLLKAFPELKYFTTSVSLSSGADQVLAKIKGRYEERQKALIERFKKGDSLSPRDLERLKEFRANWGGSKFQLTPQQLVGLEEKCGSLEGLKAKLVAEMGAATNVDDATTGRVATAFPGVTRAALSQVWSDRTLLLVGASDLVSKELTNISPSGVYKADSKEAQQLFDALTKFPENLTQKADGTARTSSEQLQLAQFYIQHAVETGALEPINCAIMKQAFAIVKTGITMTKLDSGIDYLNAASDPELVLASERSKTFAALNNLLVQDTTLFEQVTDTTPATKEQVKNGAELPDQALKALLKNSKTSYLIFSTNPLEQQLNQNQQKLLIGGLNVQSTVAPESLDSLTVKIFDAVAQETSAKFFADSEVKEQMVYCLPDVEPVVEGTPLTETLKLAEVRTTREKLSGAIEKAQNEKIMAIGDASKSLPPKLRKTTFVRMEGGSLEPGYSEMNAPTENFLNKQKKPATLSLQIDKTSVNLSKIENAAKTYRALHAGSWIPGRTIPRLSDAVEKAALENWLRQTPQSGETDQHLLQECYLEALLGEPVRGTTGAKGRLFLEKIGKEESFSQLLDADQKVLIAMVEKALPDKAEELKLFCKLNREIPGFAILEKHLSGAIERAQEIAAAKKKKEGEIV